MRRTRFFVACSAVLMFSACAHDTLEEPVHEQGEITISLVQEELPQSKADDTYIVPDLADLRVEIFKSSDKKETRLFRDVYQNAQGRRIPLNCADYRLLASYGDSLAVGFSSDDVYYSGQSAFTVRPLGHETVTAHVGVSNIRVAVAYGENLRYDYPEFYAKVKSCTRGGKIKVLEFDADETRAGFVPEGTVTFELYVKIDDTWMYYHADEILAEPGDFITFNVETKRLESSVALDISVIQPDELPKVYTVGAECLPADAPEVKIGSLEDSPFELEPGDSPVSGLKMDLKADGQIKECWLHIDSEYLRQNGVPEKVNLADPDLGMDDPQSAAAVREVLESVGLRWMDEMSGSRLGYVDFSGVTDFIVTNPTMPVFDADFTVELIDNRQKTDQTTHVSTVTTGTVSFIQNIPSPSLSVSGFSDFLDGRIEILEGTGVTYDGLSADIQAKGGIAHCWLEIDSPYMSAAGLTESRYDLAQLDAETAVILKSFGLSWTEDMKGSFKATVDFSGISDYMDRNMYDGTNTAFAFLSSLSVESMAYRDPSDAQISLSGLGEFRYTLPEATVSGIQDYNVWAKKIYDFSVDLTKGNPQCVKLQYSTDGGTVWNDINHNLSLVGTKLSCSKLVTSSDTPYDIRAIYHDNPNLTLSFNRVVTETEQQVGNATFDDWQIQDYTYYLKKVWTMGGNYTSRDWYLPTCQWWSVNSKRTMPAETTPQEQPYKVFPAVSFSVDTPSGTGSSAQMVGVYVCNMATSSSDGDGALGSLGGFFGGVDKKVYRAAGEIFIGKADDNGYHTSDGHDFASRPDKLKFQYKYSSHNSETFQMKILLKDSSGNVIMTHEITGGAAADWTEYTLPLEYQNKKSKASSIYMSFRAASCADDAISHSHNVSIEMAGSEYKGHLGSILKVDDIELIYE